MNKLYVEIDTLRERVAKVEAERESIEKALKMAVLSIGAAKEQRNDVARKLSKLEAERDALKKDKARLDSIENILRILVQEVEAGSIVIDTTPVGQFRLCIEQSDDTFTGDTLRDAIDAAKEGEG